MAKHQRVATILKEEAKKQMDLLIAQKAHDLVEAGLLAAMGSAYIYKIDAKSKKVTLLTDANEIAYAISEIKFNHSTEPDSEYFYATKEKPNYRAIEMLLNRTFGKPKESLDLTGEVKFSLRELGQRAEELYTGRSRDIDYEEVPSILPVR